MEKRYQEFYQMNKSVVQLYLKLAELEVQNKKRTKEYRDMFSLLKFAIDCEKNYICMNPKIGREQYVSVMTRQPKDHYFVTLEPDILATIRFVNYLDNEYFYTLFGVILDEKVQDLQKKNDLNFFYEILKGLKLNHMTKEERKNLVDFQYGICSTSPSVEDVVCTSEKILPVIHMTEEELKVSSVYIYPIVKQLLDYLFGITDCDITFQTLPLILYVKSCIGMLPPLIADSIVKKVENFIGVNQLYGYVTQENRDKICSMLNYLVETEFQKAKK